jgi:hypothetical protein
MDRKGSVEKVASIVNNSMRSPEGSSLLNEKETLMKRFIKMRSIMLTIALLLGTLPVAAHNRPSALNGKGLAGLTLSDDNDLDRPLALKPFALSGSGVAAYIIDEAGNVIGATTAAAGTATHLGSWTAVGTVRFTNDNGVIRSSGAATITAANGDKLEVAVEGTLDPNTGMDQGVFRFAGGTGRFERASGSANSVVTTNPLNNGFELTLVGKIDF